MSENEETFTLTGCAVDFVNADGENAFVRVAPYCDAPQIIGNGERVTQRFDRASADTVVESFKDNARRLLARLGFAKSSIPFFNGHPDFANSKDEAGRDTQVYAEATDLEARDDGLFARIQRFPLLEDLKNAFGGNLKISPRWLCRRDSADGTFKPFKLLSFGLVENGNLPNADFINGQDAPAEQQAPRLTVSFTPEQSAQIAALLGLDAGPEGVDGDAVVDAVRALVTTVNIAQNAVEDSKRAIAEQEAANNRTETDKDDGNKQADEKPETAGGNEKEEQPAPEDADKEADGKDKEADGKADDDEEEADDDKEADDDDDDDEKKKLRAELANALLAVALAKGKILPNEREAFAEKFKEDFVNAKAELEARPVCEEFSNTAAADAVMADANEKAEVKAEVLGYQDAARRFNSLVDDAEKANGGDRDSAYTSVLGTREGRDLWNASKKRTF